MRGLQPRIHILLPLATLYNQSRCLQKSTIYTDNQFLSNTRLTALCEICIVKVC
jgi:hypothetical protein